MMKISNWFSALALGGALVLGACSDDAASTPDQGPGVDQTVADQQTTDQQGDAAVKDDVSGVDLPGTDLPGADLVAKADSIQSCTTCHGTPPSTGHHVRHKSLACATCHSEVVDTTMKIINATLHNNGTKNVKGSFTWNGTSCSSLACHGTKAW